MPEEVNLDKSLNVIRIRSWGDVTIDDWNRSRSEVIRVNRESGVNRLLVDVTAQTSAPTTLDIFDFGSEWPADIRAAIVIGEATREDQEFLENVAMNRARAMRTFEDLDEALEWLENGPD